MNLCRRALQQNTADFTSILASWISGKFQMILTMACIPWRRWRGYAVDRFVFVMLVYFAGFAAGLAIPWK